MPKELKSPFFKALRRYLRAACSEKIESLSTQLGVSSDKELARCLNTNIRNIQDIRQRGSLCALEELCEKADIMPNWHHKESA